MGQRNRPGIGQPTIGCRKAENGPSSSCSPAATRRSRGTDAPGGADGGIPQAPVAVGKDSVLYGTAEIGGTYNWGTVFSLTPPTSAGGAWTQAVLLSFDERNGGNPLGALVIGPNGVLYGTTVNGGAHEFGTVFSLTPPVVPGDAWAERVLYSFAGGSDGAAPVAGVWRASDGVLYGTTYAGGSYNVGVAFKLIPPSAPDEHWTEEVLHTFGASGDGAYPSAGLTYSRGLFFGTTDVGGVFGYGTAYVLSPPGSAAGTWTESVLYSFPGGADGIFVTPGLVAAPDGVLYGATVFGPTGGGTVFSLTPPAAPGESWTVTVIYSLVFTPPQVPGGVVGSMVLIQRSGVLYGTDTQGGGTIFQLSPPAAPGTEWTYTPLFGFAGPNGDGVDGIALGPGGVLYGTTYGGGPDYSGTVFSFTL
jgi:uncharacterized repeat protein (TIGR03803 family)